MKILHLLYLCYHFCLSLMLRLRLKYVCATVIAIMVLDFFGVFTHFFELSYDTSFAYPYEGDIHEFVMALKHKEKPRMKPINDYDYSSVLDNKEKCIEQGYKTFRIVYVIKSSIDNFHRRAAIRNSWGFEKRFFDVPSRTVFLLGVRPNDEELQAKVNLEHNKHRDIIQMNFIDSYYNNTIKTMLGFKWLIKYCANAKFYMFVDDDMYVSVKNVLRFIRNPTNYPDYLKDQKKLWMHKREIKDFSLNETLKTSVMSGKGNRTIFNNITKSMNLNEIEIQAEKSEKVWECGQFYNNSHPMCNNTSPKMEETGIETNKHKTDATESARHNMKKNSMYNNNTSVLQRTKRQMFHFELPDDVRLFAGFVFVSRPHRHKSSKWYVPLEEYPYHLWPPYVTAGAYILSKEAFADMYYSSLYTKHFRFDDIFLGLVAKKAGIEPYHCEEFHFYKKDYTKFNYKYVIASHGYGDPNELLYVWNEQKALGNA